MPGDGAVALLVGGPPVRARDVGVFEGVVAAAEVGEVVDPGLAASRVVVVVVDVAPVHGHPAAGEPD